MANGKKIPPVELRNVQILFRNFSGRKEKFNDAGRRNFVVLLDDETAKKLEDDQYYLTYNLQNSLK